MRKCHLPALISLLAGALLCLVVLVPSAALAGPRVESRVERAQHQLNTLGCNAGQVDGHLGERTRSAVVRFQSRHRLKQDGRLDQTTWKRLFAEAAQRCDTRPVPGHTGRGRRVVISQRQNWVWLVGRDGRAIAQSGMVDNPAVLHPGTKRVGSYCGRGARIRRNTDGHGLWLEQFVRFAPCGIGFHRIPTYKANGRQIHADWLVGTDLQVSHGCIRVPRPFSIRVWQFANVGTQVRVVRG